MFRCSKFVAPKIQGAQGWAQVFGGCFAGWLLRERACCGLDVWLWLWARAAYFWWVWLVAGWPAGCLVGGLVVVGRVCCLFGSCGQAEGVHAPETRLEPIAIEAWRGLGS